jgi:hypothetical protein
MNGSEKVPPTYCALDRYFNQTFHQIQCRSSEIQDVEGLDLVESYKEGGWLDEWVVGVREGHRCVRLTGPENYNC